jgi:hypothetical protein
MQHKIHYHVFIFSWETPALKYFLSHITILQFYCKIKQKQKNYLKIKKNVKFWNPTQKNNMLMCCTLRILADFKGLYILLDDGTS